MICDVHGIEDCDSRGCQIWQRGEGGMSEIKRYDWTPRFMGELSTGFYVSYSDHEAALSAARKENEELKAGKIFPIMDGPSVPWGLMLPHERQSQKNHSQTLRDIARRGGFSSSEAWAIINDVSWQDAVKRWTVEEMSNLWKEYANKENSYQCRAEKAEAERGEEIGRWQQAIYKLVCGYVPDTEIDGSGCDSGDPLDLTLVEIEQGFVALKEKNEKLMAERNNWKYTAVQYARDRDYYISLLDQIAVNFSTELEEIRQALAEVEQPENTQPS